MDAISFMSVGDAMDVFCRIMDTFSNLNQAVDASRIDVSTTTGSILYTPSISSKPFNRNVSFVDLISDVSNIPKETLVESWRNTPAWDVPLTNCVSTHNNLKYLRLAVQSARENSFFRNSPLFVHAENCTDGTYEWLSENQRQYKFKYITEDNDIPRGIGGGMNFCADIASTPYVNFIHADFYCGHDWDWELLLARLRYHGHRAMSFSYRVQPDIFDEVLSRMGTIIVDPEEFGELHSNFDAPYFLEWSDAFRKLNDFEIPKAEGVSGLISKDDWDHIGGNDPLFAPASYEDMDLFMRMTFEGYRFVMTSKSIVYHFGARSSHFPNDEFDHSAERQLKSEEKNKLLWKKKWGPEPKLNQYQMWGTQGLEDRYAYLKRRNKLKRFNGTN